MKIGVVVDNELNIDVRVLREIEILREYGHDIFVLCFGFDKKLYPDIDGIKITRFNISKKLKDILFFFLNTIPVYEWLWASQIRKFIRKKDIKALHVHDLYMARTAHNGIKSSGRRIPLVLDLHENYPFTITTYNWTKGLIRSFLSQPKRWAKKEHKYLAYADRIIVLSEEFRDTLTDRYDDMSADLFTVLPNVPDISHLQMEKSVIAESPFNKNFPIVFYYGVIAERRGVFDALDVLRSLVKEKHEVNLLLIGPVDKKDTARFHNEITDNFLGDRVKHIPWIDAKDLPAYLEIVDICIAPFHKNPQHESGVANKIFEYMSGAKPIVASDCKPQKEIIEKHNCGLIFSNIKEFKNAVLKLLKENELRELMGRNGNEAVKREYHTGKVKEALILLYRQLDN